MERRRLELHDMQGLIASGHGNLRASRFLFLRFPREAGRARAWLAGLVGQVTSASFRRRVPAGAPRGAMERAVHVAFTRSGLEALGLDGECLRTFSPPFYEGMAAPARSRLLGDLGPSDPGTWEIGSRRRGFHALLMLYAPGAGEIAALVRAQTRALRAAGLSVVHADGGARTPEEKEHFGFRDGISQPRVKGLDRASHAPNLVEPGEFILGYPSEIGGFPRGVVVPERDDPRGLLPPSRFKGWRDFGRNGSYLVFRKLSQDVRGFWRYFLRQGGGSRRAAVALASKAMGRWPSGAPLHLAPDRDHEALGADRGRNNRFGFSASDPSGLACPFGSHVRRSNPRDGLSGAFWPDPSDSKMSMRVSNRHRLLRRGRPYGAFVRDPLKGPFPRGERGLMFFCLNTDIARQFEFVQQAWINNPKFAGLSRDADPVVGANDLVPGARVTLPARPVSRKMAGLPRFTRVRGGAYLFLPGMRALRFLCGAPA